MGTGKRRQWLTIDCGGQKGTCEAQGPVYEVTVKGDYQRKANIAWMDAGWRSEAADDDHPGDERWWSCPVCAGVSVEQLTFVEGVPKVIEARHIRAAQAHMERDEPAAANEPKVCQAGSDGDCPWGPCPQLRDGEPVASGRHCPLDLEDEESWEGEL